MILVDPFTLPDNVTQMHVVQCNGQWGVTIMTVEGVAFFGVGKDMTLACEDARHSAPVLLSQVKPCALAPVLVPA